MTSQRGNNNLGSRQYRNRDVLDATYVNVCAMLPMWSDRKNAEKATIAGICRRHTCRAYADPISIL